jgi:hypothetical protein
MAAPQGHARYGGRGKGVKNLGTQQRERRIRDAMKIAETFLGNTAFRGDAHALLICIYKDPSQPLAVRIDCAKAALPYEKPRLAAVEVKPIGTPGFALPAPIDGELPLIDITEFESCAK